MSNENPFAAPMSDFESQSDDTRLAGMTLKDIKSLKNASTNLRAIGVLAVLFLVIYGGALFAGISVDGEYLLEQVILLANIAYLVLMIGISLFRPRWGRSAGLAICYVYLGIQVFGLFIGMGGLLGIIITLMVLWSFQKGVNLFGPNRITHKELVTAVKEGKKLYS